MKRTERTSILQPSFRRSLAFLPFMCVMLAGMLLSAPAHASLTLTTTADRDTFITSYYPDSSFGTKGAMEIAAPTASQNRTVEALFSFNTSSLKTQFDTAYGVGGWVVSSVSVILKSNNPTAGKQPNNTGYFNVIAAGYFTLSWLSNDSWNENTVTWNNISGYLAGTGSNLQEAIGTYHFIGDGTSPLTWALSPTTASGFLSDLLSGGEISIFGTPDAVVSYLFNTNTQGNPPILTVTVDAAPVPVPAALWLLGPGLAALGIVRRRVSGAASRRVTDSFESGRKIP